MYKIINYYQENSHAISEFKLASRFLWNDHVSYTRNAIISNLSKLPDVDAISTRLIKNQSDIGDFISPYYSTQQVSTYVDLLKQHIIIAVDVINGVSGAEPAWRENGNNIVSYMYQLNPIFWSTSLIMPMWTDHLDMTIAQVESRNAKMWDNDIESYDLNHQHMSKFADLFAIGIVYQHMDKFCLIG